jgi:hypothetical protein
VPDAPITIRARWQLAEAGGTGRRRGCLTALSCDKEYNEAGPGIAIPTVYEMMEARASRVAATFMEF